MPSATAVVGTSWFAADASPPPETPLNGRRAESVRARARFSLLPWTAASSKAVCVPVIASGGAKLPEHFLQIFKEGAADAALAASIFHDGVQRIRALKEFLAAKGVEVRLSC